MNWLKSRLFWKITGLYALLSSIALAGLMTTMSSRFERQASTEQQASISAALDTISDELHSGITPNEVIETWKARMANQQATLWLLDENNRSVIATGDPPPSDIAIQSIVQMAVRSDRSMRRIRIGTERQGYIAFARNVAPGVDRATTEILLALVRDDVAAERAAPVRSAITTSVLFMWLIGIICAAFVAASLVRPLQAMSLKLDKSAEKADREDMLLSISDRHDELGHVATSLHRMEEERQERIDALHVAEQEARSSADLLSAVLDSMVEGVIAIDPEQRIVFMNTGARRLLGIRRVIGVGHRLYEAVRVPAFLETVQDALTSKKMQTLEYRTARERAHLALVVIPILTGPHAGAVTVVRDVSEIRRLEAMRRDFVSGVSHELKTPLTVIQACTDTLLDGALSDPTAAERFLKQISEQSERLLQLIIGMLQLARVESGQQLLHFEPVDVFAVAQDALRGFQTIADTKSVSLVLTGAKEMKVVADDQAVQTILCNLVDNALKHTDAGGIVTVELKVNELAPTLIVLDTGTGIPEEVLGRIFERFYRVDRDRSRERGGTGLGLAIVKHLCQSLGATISVTSTLGQGSEFRVQFPRS